MRRFLNFDRVEQMRNDAAAAEVRRNGWIRDKADQLARQFPECAMDFYRTSLVMSPYDVGLNTDKAQDAYAAFVETVCLAQAEKLYSDAYFLGEVA